MSKVFLRKQFSNYLGENRALDDIVVRFIQDVSPSPTPTPITPTPTPTPSITPTSSPIPVSPTPSITQTNTPPVSPSPTPTSSPIPLTPTPTNTPSSSPIPSPTPTPTPTEPGGYKLQAENGDFLQAENGDNINIEHAPLFDPDAEAYLNAVILTGGTLDTTISAATNNLFLALKSNGLYNSLDAFYPMIGATSGSTSLNAIRTNSSFDITWNNVGDLTFNSSGVTNNGSGYGNTNYNPNTQSSPTNNSYGYYIVGGNIGGGNGEVFPFGSYDGNLNITYQNSGTITLGIYGYDTGRADIPKTGSTWNGSYIGTFNSTPIKSVYHNYSNLSERQTISGTPTGSVLLQNQPYYIFVLNLSGSPYTGQYYTGRFQFTFMGDNLTSAQVETIDSIINAFQTSLGRNTY